MSSSMKGEVLFIHGAKAFWNVHAGLKKFKEEGGKIVNRFSTKVTMVAVYDSTDLNPERYSMPQEIFDEVVRALHYASEKDLPVLTAKGLTELFDERERQKAQSMFEHLTEIQPVGAVFF